MKFITVLCLLASVLFAETVQEIIKRDNLTVRDSFALNDSENSTLYYCSGTGGHPMAQPTVFLLQRDGKAYVSESMELDETWASGGTYSSMKHENGELSLSIEFGGYSESTITAYLDKVHFPLRVARIENRYKPIIDNQDNRVWVNELWNFQSGDYTFDVGSESYDSEIIYATTSDTAVYDFSFFPIWGKSNIKANSDIMASGYVVWNQDELTFTIEVTDDHVKLGSGIHSDHIEIWFSQAPWYGKARTSEEVQLLINSDGNSLTASFGYPGSRKDVIPLNGSFVKTEFGYKTTFDIPIELLCGRKVDLKEGAKAALSIVVSDTDEKGKQETMLATSNLKWGKPRTFGRIVFVKDGVMPKLNRAVMYRLN